MSINYNSVCLYRGPSRLGADDIVILLTGLRRRSRNGKTGGMLQLWILNAIRSPVCALRTRHDRAICGTCPLRGKSGHNRTCYVDVSKAPLSAWLSWQDGNVLNAVDYPDLRERIAGKIIRYGAYGDPAAVDPDTLSQWIDHSQIHTGYTHQALDYDCDAWRGILMASCQDLTSAQKLQSAGWYTARVISDISERQPNEIICPALLQTKDQRAVNPITCNNCHKCDGKTCNVCFVVHGTAAKKAAFKSLVKQR